MQIKDTSAYMKQLKFLNLRLICRTEWGVIADGNNILFMRMNATFVINCNFYFIMQK